MLYKMTHQPHVTSQNYKSNTQLDKKMQIQNTLQPKPQITCSLTNHNLHNNITNPNTQLVNNCKSKSHYN